MSPQGVDVQNLIKIDSAVAALRMREKTRFCVGFFFLKFEIFNVGRLKRVESRRSAKFGRLQRLQATF